MLKSLNKERKKRYIKKKFNAKRKRIEKRVEKH